MRECKVLNMNDDPGIQNQLLILDMRARANSYIALGFGLAGSLLLYFIGYPGISMMLFALFSLGIFVNTQALLKIIDKHDIKLRGK